MEIVDKILEKEYIINEEKEFLDKINSEKLTDIEKEEIIKNFEKKLKLKNNLFYKNLVFVINFFIFIFLVLFGITFIIEFFQTWDYFLIIPFMIYIFNGYYQKNVEVKTRNFFSSFYFFI